VLKPAGRKPVDTNPAVAIESLRVYTREGLLEGRHLNDRIGLKDVDEDGLVEHTSRSNVMWLVDWKPDLSVELQLREVVPLSSTEIWNYNAEFSTHLGVAEVTLEVSTNGVVWRKIGKVKCREAEGNGDYDTPVVVLLTNMYADRIRLTNIVPISTNGRVGLSEVIVRRNIGARPVGVSPEDGAIGVKPGSVLLKWTGVTGAKSYHIWVGTNADSLVCCGSTHTTGYILTNVLSGRRYWWRVDAELTNGSMLKGYLARFDTAGLVAHWTLTQISQDQIQDLSGNGYHLVLRDTPCWVPAGKWPVEVLQFGRRRWSFAEGNLPVELESTRNMSVAFWVNVQEGGNASQAIIEVPNGKWRVRYVPSIQRIVVGFYSKSGERFISEALVSSTPIIPGQWYHIVVSQRRNSVELYVNGKLDSSITTNGQVCFDGDRLIIGGCPSSAKVGAFTGMLFDVRVYAFDLRHEDVSALYKSYPGVE